MTAITKSAPVRVGRGYSVEFCLKYNAEGVVMIGVEWSPRLPKPWLRTALIDGESYQNAFAGFAKDALEVKA